MCYTVVYRIDLSQNFHVNNNYFQVATEWENDKFVIEAGDEDIHTANERRLKCHHEQMIV